MWLYLSIIACVALIIYWRGPNPVWGSATIGAIGGIISASVYYFKGFGFRWEIVGKWIVVSVLIAITEEGIWKIVERIVEKIIKKNKKP